MSLLPGNHDGDRRGHLGTAGCEIEAGIRGHRAADRLAVRQVESRPLVTELRVWFEAQIAKLPARGPTAEAIRYALNHWDGLARFVDDGRIELDTNSVEGASASHAPPTGPDAGAFAISRTDCEQCGQLTRHKPRTSNAFPTSRCRALSLSRAFPG